MERLNRVLDWLTNHELVGCAILIGLMGIMIFSLVFWVGRGTLPPLDDSDDYGAPHG